MHGSGWGRIGGVRRRLPGFMSILSMLLCVALTAIWIASYFARPTTFRKSTWYDSWGDGYEVSVSIVTIRNGIVYFRKSNSGPRGTLPPGSRLTRTTSWSGWHLGNVPVNSTILGFSCTAAQVSVPLWVFILCLLAVGRFMRPPPPRHGECLTCGYDLTGNTSGVCPECGSGIAQLPRS